MTKLKLYFWQGLHVDPETGRRIDTRDVCAAPSKKRLLEITDWTDRPSNLFNLRVVTDVERELARNPALQVVLDEPETVFWQQMVTLDRTWRKA